MAEWMRANRTLLEMWAGILVWALCCLLAGLWFVPDKGKYALSLALGCVLAMLSSWHMARTLDKALDMGMDAGRKVFTGFLLRNLALLLVLIYSAYTGLLYFLAIFLAYMGLKVTALIQPLTHRCCNKVFHEEERPLSPMEGDMS